MKRLFLYVALCTVVAVVLTLITRLSPAGNTTSEATCKCVGCHSQTGQAKECCCESCSCPGCQCAKPAVKDSKCGCRKCQCPNCDGTCRCSPCQCEGCGCKKPAADAQQAQQKCINCLR